MRLVRHLAVLTGLGGLVLMGYHVAASASTPVASLGDDDVRTGGGGFAEHVRDLTTSYSLSNLSILGRTASRVQIQYVDPDRIDYAEMYEAALAHVEREIPEVVLRVDGARVHVQVENYSTVLTTRPIDDAHSLTAELRRVAQILEEHLDNEELKFDEVEYGLTNGMLSTLDPHSRLLPPEDSRRMEEDNEGEFGGLGITIKLDAKGRLMVEYPLQDTPASKAGLKPLDEITHIDGESTVNMDIDEAVEKMRGLQGTSVTLSILREGLTSPQDFTIVRAQIKPGRVWGQLLEGGVGYVYVNNFHKEATIQLEAELSRLGRDAGPGGLRGLVLDMRDNPGGYLHQAVEMADQFLARGVIVSTVGREGAERKENSARASGTEPAYPMAVLMTGSSASAAEIVAGALRNNERAVIIGERSFGKGSVQELYPMERDTRLKLTVARYLTPGDHWIQSVGIPPDIELKRARVSPPKEINGVMSGPMISLFGRENLMRESDLPSTIMNADEAVTPPAYSLRYLAPESSPPASDRRDMSLDFEVMLARDVLLAARGPRRADVLRDAATVVAQRSRIEASAIETAFRKQTIDWSECANPERADVRFDLSFDSGAGFGPGLVSGALTTVRLAVTNDAAQPLCQTVARLESEEGNDVLHGIEFYLGRIAANETRTYETRVEVPGGYPDEIARVDIELSDMSRRKLVATTKEITTDGPELPHYSWSWRFDDTKGGNGNGVVEVGETVQLVVDVLNDGPGAGHTLKLSIQKDKNLRKTVELTQASAEIAQLEPGARATGILALKVKQAPPDAKVPLELEVVDQKRFDYAAVFKGEFYGWFAQTDKIVLPVGGVAPAEKRDPPRIQVTRSPASRTSDATVTISGRATDDVGVRDVIIYANDRKIAYAGGGDADHPLRSVPFSATAELDDGTNVVVVLVRDVNGLTATHSADVLRSRPVAAIEPETPPGP